MQTSVKLAWAAGFFDGDGHIGLHGNTDRPRKRPILRINQTDREVLDRFVAAVGVGHVVGPYRTRKSPVWSYRVDSFEGVQAVVAQLWSFLSSSKREQARRTLVEYAK